ncbi:MAG TPA: BON domain-containing protein [Nannocystaceae bacterium]|nr:BON domain-containing protein [Nannocystaceae bacterium]
MHRYDRNESQSQRRQYDDRDERSRSRDDERSARERDDQYRWATDRDNFGGGDGRRDRERDGEQDMQSRGWGRDDYGFRGPRFEERDDFRDPEMRQRRDRWDASGGYSDDRGRYGQQGRSERSDAGGGRGMGSNGGEYGRGMGSYGSEYGRGRDGAMPGRGAGGSYGSGPMPNEGELRASHRGKGPKNFTRSDERIREDVCERLEHSHDVDASNIEVRVANGEVTLEGTVDDRRAKREAEDVACEARGVKDVHNLLKVGGKDSTSTGTSASQSSNGSRTGATRSTEAGRS